MHPKDIKIADYTYSLPGEKIAFHPLPDRDASKLLIWNSEKISDDLYKNIADYLLPESFLVFNDTRVIPARIFFISEAGAKIELFCLEPFDSKGNYHAAMESSSPVLWKCLIGKADKWKTKFLEKTVITGDRNVLLKVQVKDKLPDSFVIEFLWDNPDVLFADILDVAGNVPLPPYIKRAANQDDVNRYQTVFAHHKGSVAAPTAGLHFTTGVIESIHKKNIDIDFVTLHVGAGTFKPVKSEFIGEHLMHTEWIIVRKQTIENILKHSSRIIAVGTTSLRTIETLYWMGAKAFINPLISEDDIAITQWEVYDDTQLGNVNIADALNALLISLDNNGKEKVICQTQIIIAPGYKFKLVKGLVTNFHQPNSTLLLIIAATTNSWRRIYDHALNNDYRFLSYGDGCLIFFEEI